MQKTIRNKKWHEWEREYAFADAQYQRAAKVRAQAKDKLIDLMGKADLIPPEGESTFAEGDVLRVRLTMSKGRTSFDKELLFSDYPNISRDEYETVGKPSMSFKAEVLPGAVLNAHDEEEEVAA